MQNGLTTKNLFQIIGLKKWPRGEMAAIFLKNVFFTLYLRNPEKTSLSRISSFNKFNINAFLDNMEDAHRHLGPFSPKRIWNLDDTGLITVQFKINYYSKTCKADWLDHMQLVMLIICVNAIWNYIPLVLNFPRVHFKEFMPVHDYWRSKPNWLVQ